MRAWGLNSKGFGEPEATEGPHLASPVRSLRAGAASASERSHQRLLKLEVITPASEVPSLIVSASLRLLSW